MTSVLLVAALFVLFALLSYYWMFMSRKAQLASSIPGPRPIPFLGNALEFTGDSVDILRTLIRLWKQYGNILRLWFGPFLYVGVADAKHAEIFLSSTTNISKSLNYRFLEPWLGTGLLTSKGNKWKYHRRIITPTFHFKILEDFIGMFNKNGNLLVQKLRKEVNGQEFDIHKYITLCALDIICEAAMGVQMNMQNNGNLDYITALGRVADIVSQRSMRPWLFFDFAFNLTRMGKSQNEYVKSLHETSNKVIERRKKEFLLMENQGANKEQENEFGQKKRLAFLDLLLQYNRDGGNLSDEEIREEVDTFMFEGHDTVSSGLSFCMWLLAKNPQCQEKAYEELLEIFGNSNRDATVDDLQQMKYLDGVVKETMRIFPSVPLFLRELDEDVKLDGFHLIAGTTIVVLPFLIHRDPNYFPEPEKFDPERFFPENSRGRNPYAYVPFSAGPRNCIGQRFAMMEMKSLVSKILRNYKLLPGSKELVLSAELVLRSCSGINVKLEMREGLKE